MPVQSDSEKGSPRPDRIGTRIRARRVPEALATDIASPEHPVAPTRQARRLILGGYLQSRDLPPGGLMVGHRA